MNGEKGHRRLDWAFAQEGCDSTAKLLLVCMAKLGNRNGTCFMAVSRLAKMMCASVKTVQRAIRRLLAAGLIFEVRPRGATGRRTKTYAFGCDRAPEPVGQTAPSDRDKWSSGKRQNDGQNPLNQKKGINRFSASSHSTGTSPRGQVKPIGAILDSFAVNRHRSEGGT